MSATAKAMLLLLAAAGGVLAIAGGVDEPLVVTDLVDPKRHLYKCILALFLYKTK